MGIRFRRYSAAAVILSAGAGNFSAYAAGDQVMVETTAFGAAALAGLSCGMWSGLEELAALRRSQRQFVPQRRAEDCEKEYALWQRAVGRAGNWIEH